MSEYLYERFLEDRDIYFSARAFWIGQLRRVFGRGENFTYSYTSEKYVNGTFFLDGNPIASVVNWHTKRAVRIVQLSPQDFGEYYSDWNSPISLIKGSSMKHVNISEKVIALTLTKHTFNRARSEIEKWSKG
jgi:hypothetical protein